MGKSDKINEAKRVRYIRSLERFLNSIVSYLFKTQDLTKENYAKKVTNAFKVLAKAEMTTLYKEDYKNLEKLVNKIKDSITKDDDIQSIKKEILYESNQLKKSKNNKKYKKPKYSNDYEY